VNARPTRHDNSSCSDAGQGGPAPISIEVASTCADATLNTSFRTVGNPEVTNSVGGFSFPFVDLLENAQLRVVTVGKPVVVSPVVVESVAVRVSFHVRRACRRGFVRLYGTVAPAEVGALVGFQLLRPGRSVNEGGTAVRAGTASVSRFRAVVRLRHRGLYRALIKVSNDGGHVSNYSEPILIR